MLNPPDATSDDLLDRAVKLHQDGRLSEAEALYSKILSDRSDHFQALHMLGVLKHQSGLPEEGLRLIASALEIRPAHAIAHWNESLILLAMGNFRDGWKRYEWRFEDAKFPTIIKYFSTPQWTGAQEIAGKAIVLHPEQGLGDTIQFVRYVPLVAARGASVILIVQEPLKALLSRLPGAARILSQGDSLPPHDLHCPLLSLPLAFQTELATIPAAIPYLSAPSDRVANWKARIPGDERLRIGLAWAGRATNWNDRNRSVPLQFLMPLLDLPGIDFVSLQKELRPQNEELLQAKSHVLRLGESFADFADTAAVISALDVVLTVDTAVAHLAGAMGKPVWILLPFYGDFRWMLTREDSPWYPTARLFRQPRIGDWASVIALLAREIANLREMHGRR